MLKRYELHNHTLESDASQSCAELIGAMERECVDVFALTDHNTVSGHRKIRRLLNETPRHTRAIYGMEYTTYYGHILCQNLNTYVPWDSIDRHKPELLFEACRASGALVGIAHPFAFGDPFARGCRFEMDITDFSSVDYIEIINNAHSMREVNLYGIAWWESLVLAGKPLAATAGMDMHRDTVFAMKFATYIESNDGDPAQELIAAVHAGRTWVSNGMALKYEKTPDGAWLFTLEDLKKPGFRPGEKYIMTLRNAAEEKEYELSSDGLTLTDGELPGGEILIPKLYADKREPESLVCVSPVIRR